MQQSRGSQIKVKNEKKKKKKAFRIELHTIYAEVNQVVSEKAFKSAAMSDCAVVIIDMLVADQLICQCVFIYRSKLKLQTHLG